MSNLPRDETTIIQQDGTQETETLLDQKSADSTGQDNKSTPTLLNGSALSQQYNQFFYDREEKKTKFTTLIIGEETPKNIQSGHVYITANRNSQGDVTSYTFTGNPAAGDEKDKKATLVKYKLDPSETDDLSALFNMIGLEPENTYQIDRAKRTELFEQLLYRGRKDFHDHYTTPKQRIKMLGEQLENWKLAQQLYGACGLFFFFPAVLAGQELALGNASTIISSKAALAKIDTWMIAGGVLAVYGLLHLLVGKPLEKHIGQLSQELEACKDIKKTQPYVDRLNNIEIELAELKNPRSKS